MANIIQDDNYYQISGWMINRLGLKGVALNVYAIIYGYSQAESNVFSGSRQYLADFIGVTRPTIDNALNSLLEKEYITKFSSVINGVTFVSYKATPSILQGVKNFDTPCKKTLHNNKEDNIEKENSIKESCEIRNGNQVTTSFVANNENLVHAQSVELGTVTPTSTNTNMFVVDNEQNELQQKQQKGAVTYTSTNNKESSNNIVSVETINEYFDKTYEIYPKKVSKEQARKTYEHKFRGLEQEDARKLANYIYINLEKQVHVWENEYGGKGREREFVPHMSTWLNDNIPDSPHFKGKKQ